MDALPSFFWTRAIAAGALEVLAGVAFAIIAPYFGDDLAKYTPFLVAFVLVCGISWRPSKQLAWARLLLFAGVIAMAATLGTQAAGFAFFPGLVKGIAPFSSSHLALAMQVFTIAWSLHCVLLVLLRLIRSFQRVRKIGRV